MTGLLELREKVKMIYSRNAAFILPIIKFLLAFVTLNIVNGKMGYMVQLDNIAVVLIVGLLCSFLPAGSILFFGALFSLGHMYALSIEAAIVGICAYLLLYLLFLRFGYKESLVVVLTPVLCVLKVPYVMPVAMGLIGTPASAVSVGCGVIVYYVLAAITESAPAIGTMGEEEATAKLRLLIDAVLGNKEMLVMVAAFAITVIVVYLIRRMAVDYNWTIAMIAGAITNLAILLVGDLMYDTNLSLVNAIVGAVAAIAAGKMIEFFRFCVDYSRTEKVQYEDDEYYYYVKAVPKMTVAAPTKTVKKINAQKRPGVSSARSSAGMRDNAGMRGNAGMRENAGVRQAQSPRNVTTERVSREEYYGNSRQRGFRSNGMNGGRSMTINSSMTESDTDGAEDDYTELF